MTIALTKGLKGPWPSVSGRSCWRRHRMPSPTLTTMLTSMPWMRAVFYDPALRASEHRGGRAQGARRLPDRWRPDQVSPDFTPEITGSPLLCEHTDDVLTELGYDAESIATMHADRIV